MLQNNFEVSILVNGQPVKEYFHDGRMYIEGRPNAEYKIRVKNNGYRRIVVVPTVDGLSVIDGKPATYDAPGYIIPGYTTDTIDGWRSDDDTVNSFYFSAGKDSYVKRNGQDATNIGVIGVAVFEERGNYKYIKYVYEPSTWTYPWGTTISSGSVSVYTSRTTASTNLLNAGSTALNNSSNISVSNTASEAISLANQSLGTGWGEEKKSSVKWVGFDRLSEPSAVFELFYHTREELEKLGINMKDSGRTYAAGPQAFPHQYCVPPKK